MLAFKFTKKTSATWKNMFCHEECTCLTLVSAGMLLFTVGVLSQSGRRENGELGLHFVPIALSNFWCIVNS